MYLCDDYCTMTTYDMKIPITIRLCVPADTGLARCLHTCDPMIKGLYFNVHTCLCLLSIHTYHVHGKNVHFCTHLPFPYVRSSTSSLSVSIPSTSTRAHVWTFTSRQFNPHKTNTCPQENAKQHIYSYLIHVHIKWT